MPSRYLLDENLRGPLWQAIQKYNSSGLPPIDTLRVGDPVDLPLGSNDADILLWAEREWRILVTFDAATIPAHLAAHLVAGHHSPGVFVIRPYTTLPQIVFILALAAHAGDPAQVEDGIEYIP